MFNTSKASLLRPLIARLFSKRSRIIESKYGLKAPWTKEFYRIGLCEKKSYMVNWNKMNDFTKSIWNSLDASCLKHRDFGFFFSTSWQKNCVNFSLMYSYVFSMLRPNDNCYSFSLCFLTIGFGVTRHSNPTFLSYVLEFMRSKVTLKPKERTAP